MLSKNQRGAKHRRRLPHQSGRVQVQSHVCLVAEVEEDGRAGPCPLVVADEVALSKLLRGLAAAATAAAVPLVLIVEDRLLVSSIGVDIGAPPRPPAGEVVERGVAPELAAPGEQVCRVAGGQGRSGERRGGVFLGVLLRGSRIAPADAGDGSRAEDGAAAAVVASGSRDKLRGRRRRGRGRRCEFEGICSSMRIGAKHQQNEQQGRHRCNERNERSLRSHLR